MTIGKRLLHPIALDPVAGSDRLRQIQTPGFILPKRVKMGGRFFVVCCHGLESRSSPALPARFVMMFLLILIAASLQWLHNFSAIVNRRKNMNNRYFMTNQPSSAGSLHGASTLVTAFLS
jgi:hypothetical protein